MTTSRAAPDEAARRCTCPKQRLTGCTWQACTPRPHPPTTAPPPRAAWAQALSQRHARRVPAGMARATTARSFEDSKDGRSAACWVGQPCMAAPVFAARTDRTIYQHPWAHALPGAAATHQLTLPRSHAHQLTLPRAHAHQPTLPRSRAPGHGTAQPPPAAAGLGRSPPAPAGAPGGGRPTRARGEPRPASAQSACGWRLRVGRRGALARTSSSGAGRAIQGSVSQQQQRLGGRQV